MKDFHLCTKDSVQTYVCTVWYSGAWQRKGRDAKGDLVNRRPPAEDDTWRKSARAVPREEPQTLESSPSHAWRFLFSILPSGRLRYQDQTHMYMESFFSLSRYILSILSYAPNSVVAKFLQLQTWQHCLTQTGAIKCTSILLALLAYFGGNLINTFYIETTEIQMCCPRVSVGFGAALLFLERGSYQATRGDSTKSLHWAKKAFQHAQWAIFETVISVIYIYIHT